LINYLKGSLLLCQHYISGRITKHEGDIRIASAGGLPLIIPGPVRISMRSGEIGLIKTVLGILSLYRVLPCKGKEKLETITDKYSGLIPVLPLLEVDSLFRELFQPLRGNLPAGRKFLLNMKTAGPNFKPAILGAAADAYSHAQHRLLLYPIQVLSTFFESEIHNQLREEIHVVKN
jgi:hypothetical protein